jgi:hypothetical protein
MKNEKPYTDKDQEVRWVGRATKRPTHKIGMMPNTKSVYREQKPHQHMVNLET